MERKKLKRTDLIYPDLCYYLVGILFEVYNEIGSGYHEKYYQRAIGEVFKKCRIPFREQVLVPLKFRGSKIGKYFLDFVVDDKIVLEVKRGEGFARANINQIYCYLKAVNLKLGILINFTNKGLKFKRIVNLV